MEPRRAWLRAAAALAALLAVLTWASRGTDAAAADDPGVERYLQRMAGAQQRFYAWSNRPVPPKAWEWRLSGPDKATSPRQVLLLSYPNSGTTWTKQLFEAATNTASMAVYRQEGSRTYDIKNCRFGRCKAFYESSGRVASPVSPAAKQAMRGGYNFTSVHRESVAFVKTHRAPRGFSNLHPWDMIIHVVRHPIDNAVANVDFIKNRPARKGRGGRGTAAPAGGKWPLNADVVEWMTGMVRTYTRWHCHAIVAAEHVPTHTVFYENLLANPVEELQKILDFMGYTSVSRSQCQTASDRAPAKYHPPLAPGLPTKWSRVSNPSVWEPLADAFLDEWGTIEANLSTIHQRERTPYFEEVCGGMLRGPFHVVR